MKINLEHTIDCSPEALWPWIDDPERCKQWMKGLVEVRPTSPGPRRAGSTAVLVIKEGGRETEYQETILEYEPAKRFKLRMVGGGLKNTAVDVDYVRHDLGGRTRLEFEVACELQSTFIKLMSPLFGLFARMHAKSLFKKLKRLAENQGGLASTM
jgi:carbon monoxide dehydrogenase subunit G